MTTTKDDGCRKYKDVAISPARFELIGQIRAIVEEYGRQGMNIMVRQVYYQFVARGLLPSSKGTYNRIQTALADGRMAGLVPWSMIVDRGRSLRGLRTQESPAQALKHMRAAYLRDLWADQQWRPEVWVEKMSLESVIGDICNPLRVDYYATKGYDSISQQWAAGQRMAQYVQRGQRPIVFYLGDHDPSGLDMPRVVAERLQLFTGVPVIVQRIALTKAQIEQYDPPPFDVKTGDSRAADYSIEHGDTAWELDALDPAVLKRLISDNVAQIRDEAEWTKSLSEEVDDCHELDLMIEQATGSE